MKNRVSVSLDFLAVKRNTSLNCFFKGDYYIIIVLRYLICIEYTCSNYIIYVLQGQN